MVSRAVHIQIEIGVKLLSNLPETVLEGGSQSAPTENHLKSPKAEPSQVFASFWGQVPFGR